MIRKSAKPSIEDMVMSRSAFLVNIRPPSPETLWKDAHLYVECISAVRVAASWIGGLGLKLPAAMANACICGIPNASTATQQMRAVPNIIFSSLSAMLDGKANYGFSPRVRIEPALWCDGIFVRMCRA